MNDLLMVLGLLGLLVLVVLDAALLISVLRQGDERRQMIVGRASTQSFAAIALYMVFCVGEDLYRGMALGLPAEDHSPMVTLTVMALVYFVHLLYFRWKYGA